MNPFTMFNFVNFKGQKSIPTPHNNQVFLFNKAVPNNIRWNLFKMSTDRKGCSSCGSR